MEITKTADMLRVYIQKKFDSYSKHPGIIGVTYNSEKSVYDFFLNTNRVASHREEVFPEEDIDSLKTFLNSIARTASSIADIGTSFEDLS